MALARRGLSLLEAKRVIEEALEAGVTVVVSLRLVENAQTLASELSRAGFQASTADEVQQLQDGVPELQRDHA